MENHFLVYWKAAEIEKALSSGGRLEGVSGKQLKNRTVGERLWICGMDQASDFVLIGYVDIGSIVADSIENSKDTEGGGPVESSSSGYRALPREGSSVPLRRVSLEHLLESIRFVGSGAETLDRLPNGKVNAQRLQSHRRLAPESARLLEEAWNRSRPYSGNAEVSAGVVEGVSRRTDTRPELRTREEARIESYVSRVLRNKGFLANLHFVEVNAEARKVEYLYRNVSANRHPANLVQANILVLFDSSVEPHSPFLILGYPESERDAVGVLPKLAAGDDSVSLEEILAVPEAYRFNSLADFLKGWHWSSAELESPIQPGQTDVVPRSESEGSSAQSFGGEGFRRRDSTVGPEVHERPAPLPGARASTKTDADGTEERLWEGDRDVRRQSGYGAPASSMSRGDAEAVSTGRADLTLESRSRHRAADGQHGHPDVPLELGVKPGKVEGDPSVPFEQPRPWKDWAIVVGILVLALVAFLVW